jgi:hypothetical protein
MTFTPDPSWPPISELAIEAFGQPNRKLSKRDDIRFGTNGSVHVTPSKNTWKDFESGRGGGYVDLWKLARPNEPLPNGDGNGRHKGPEPWKDIASTYPYHDADGELILEVVRTISGSPRFRQRQRTGQDARGRDKWKWSVLDIPNHNCLLYRLPGLRASGDEIVLIPEGEKDVDTLHGEGLISTCNIGGAGKWRSEYNPEFLGKPAVILPDNDPQATDKKTGKLLFHPDGRPVLPGQDHADDVARNLHGVAASVKVLMLPGLPLKGDVTWWLKNGGTVEELLRLVHEAPEYEPSPQPYSQPERPDLADCLPFRWGAELTKPQLDVQDFIEGLLTTTCLAVVYGDSNVGKSFWVLDLGLHVAGGIEWNGREVDQGIVILVSLEGGVMTDNRIIAARNRLGLPPTVPLVVVQCPIDLRTNSIDAERLVNTIKRTISDCAGPMPVRLVIIDTMSRALNGGDEGAEDMSALLANADRVRQETKVAILFVAHCGKDATKGIRGWSGIRAAIDTEIEITTLEDRAGSVAEVTKQRDLPGGDRFAFKLDPVELGLNRRDKPVTTCVVVPTDAPARTKRPDRRTPPLGDKPAELLAVATSLLAQQGEPIIPTPGMPPVTGASRKLLQRSLIAAGWFAEDLIVEDADGPKIRKPGPTLENNALTALKRRKLLWFNRGHFWLS